MHIDTIPNRNSRPAYLLRESVREGKRVRKRTLANLSSLPLDQIEAIRRILKGEKLGPVEDDASVAAEAALDGLYVLRTSAAPVAMSAEETVLNYKRLAEVERAFRTLKGVDLQVRPIRHRLETRVRAHIFLSMLAYYVQWHMIETWAPLTFKDEADAGPARLADPVAPARRSQAALAKVHTRTLADGTPATSFTRLLAHLATVVRNTMRPKSARHGEATFTLTTRPDAKQQQALDLIAAITV